MSDTHTWAAPYPGCDPSIDVTTTYLTRGRVLRDQDRPAPHGATTRGPGAACREGVERSQRSAWPLVLFVAGLWLGSHLR